MTAWHPHLCALCLPVGCFCLTHGRHITFEEYTDAPWTQVIRLSETVLTRDNPYQSVKTEEVPGKPTNVIHYNVWFGMWVKLALGVLNGFSSVIGDSPILILYSLRSCCIHLQIFSDDVNISCPVSQKTLVNIGLVNYGRIIFMVKRQSGNETVVKVILSYCEEFQRYSQIERILQKIVKCPVHGHHHHLCYISYPSTCLISQHLCRLLCTY